MVSIATGVYSELRHQLQHREEAEAEEEEGAEDDNAKVTQGLLTMLPELGSRQHQVALLNPKLPLC